MNSDFPLMPESRTGHAPSLPVRRTLLLALAGLPLGCAMLPNGRPADAEHSFALTSPERARQLAQLVPADVAALTVEAARLTLGREARPIPLVRTAGLLPGEGLRTVSIWAQDDWREIRMQALAYRLTGEAAHAERAVANLNAWMASYSPSFNPIDETQLPSLLFGFDLIQDLLPEAMIKRVRAFSSALATGYLADKVLAGDRNTESNNWHSHRIKIATAGAFASGDPVLAARARTVFMRHVLRNIRPDGSTLDFEERDAMHYVVYTLEPMLMAASMAAAHGQDWYGAPETQGRLALALDWLKPYALGERTHEEFVRSTVPFDRKRALAGVKDFSGPFDRYKAVNVYWIAARLDARFQKVNDALSPPPLWLRKHEEWKQARSDTTVGHPWSWMRSLFSQTYHAPTAAA